MSDSNRDVCVSCSKIVKQNHKNITCNKCNGYVHKKCTKLKPSELKRLNPKDWICCKCSIDINNDSPTHDIDSIENDLNENF